MKKLILRIFVMTTVLLLLLQSFVYGAYYCDPIAGSMSNNGSESSPWSSLEDVIAAGITFSANDVIYLKNGDHGRPYITQSNPGVVTIKSYPGHDPVINEMEFTNASNWKVEGVRIYSPTAPPADPVLVHPVYGIYDNYLVKLYESTNITLDNLYIYSIENSSAWTADDWNYKAWCGVFFKSHSNNNTIKNCTLKNINFAIDMSYSSSNTVQNNIIRNFCGDGLRVSTNCLVENNQIIDCYKTNGNHADAMQAFASSGAIIRNNTIISTTSDRPFMGYELQGMGFFDGFYDNYKIENNLLIIHTWNGITVNGARNSKIANNTVVENPLGVNPAGPPWIGIYNHKDGSASYGNTMINNITPRISSTAGTSLSNNIVTADYASYFVNYTGLDFHLKNGSPAINAGTNTNAPSVDLDGVVRPQDGIVDVGCYEYSGAIIDVTGVTVSPETITLELGQASQLIQTIEPSNATNHSVIWSSDNTSVVTVNGGQINAIGTGSATVSVTTVDGGYTAYCAVTVTQPSGNYNLALNKAVTVSSEDPPTPGTNLVDGDVSDNARWSASGFPQWAEIDLGEDYNLSRIDLYPYQDRAYQYIVEAKSDGGSYSTIVDRSSNITGGDVLTDNVSGTARYVKITVSGLSGGSSTWVSLAELQVWGTNASSVPVTGVSVLPITLILDKGQTSDLTETVSPSNATDKSVAWSSSNASVATVNASGLVTAVSAGNTTITVTTNDGSFTANCAVTVNDNSTGTTVDETIQAEDYTSQSGCGVASTHAGYTGSGFLDYGGNGTWGEWSTNMPGDGTITLSLRYANGSTGDRQCEVTVNGSLAGNVAFAPTGEWTNWNTATIDIDVVEGANTIRITANTSSGGPNLDKLDLDGVVGGSGTIISVTDISVSPTTLTLNEGQTSDLTETVSPSNATDKSVVWSSSNTSVAIVDANGLVTAVAAGNATITVTTNDGSFTANCTVTVNALVVPVIGVSLSPTALTLDEGQTSDLTETVSPSNATDKSVLWSSSNTSVATVDANGLVTAVAEGNAIITVTTNDGSFTANCAVTVNDNSTGVIIDETIQAEDYSLRSGCSTASNKAGYTGSGFLDYGGNGTWGEWSINISSNGTITLSLRYANGSTGDRQCEVTINGASAGNVAFVPTGSWTIWNTVTIDIDVTEGANAIRITANTGNGGPNLDKLDFDGTVMSSANLELSKNISSSSVKVYPNPLNGNTLNIKMEGYDEANIVIYDLIGKTVYNQSHSMVEQTELQIPVDNLSNGIYIISVNGNRQKLIIE